MIKALKQYYGNMQLRKLQKHRHHKAVSVNWEQVKRMGILYHCESEGDFKTVKTYVESLPEHINLSTLADLNWYYKPVSAGVRDFIQEPFDLLINLCDEDLLPLNFVLLQSHARLIAGEYTDKQWHDLMIETEKNAPKAYLLEQIERYLKMIKTQ
jgi:hypothetical protein